VTGRGKKNARKEIIPDLMRAKSVHQRRKREAVTFTRGREREAKVPYTRKKAGPRRRGNGGHSWGTAVDALRKEQFP